MSIPVVQQHQKYLPTSQNFSHGYPPHDSYPSPKGTCKFIIQSSVHLSIYSLISNIHYTCRARTD